MYEDYNNEILYTEDEIISIGDDLNILKGSILLDTHGEFFILKDFEIEGADAMIWNGLFKSKKTVRKFLIKNIVLSGDDGDYVHEDDSMCSALGVKTLIEFHDRYTKLQVKLNTFTTKQGIQLNFGKLTASPNKSSNFRRR